MAKQTQLRRNKKRLDVPLTATVVVPELPTGPLLPELKAEAKRRLEAAGLTYGGVFVPHDPTCFVYRYAEALLGVDRRGLCTCGAEQP